MLTDVHNNVIESVLLCIFVVYMFNSVVFNITMYSLEVVQ